MANYAYIARTPQGREQRGSVAGQTLDAAVGELHHRGLIVLQLSEETARQGSDGFLRKLGFWAHRRAGSRELALFTRQFATVFEAGIPLERGLRGLAADFTNPLMSRAVADLASRVERGETLAGAMAAHPEAFSAMYGSMVEAGERSGTLGEILEELAVYLEKVDTNKAKVRAALTYPLFVLFVTLVGTAVLVVQVAPTMTKIYGDFGQKLPPMTRSLLGVAGAVRSHSILLLAMLIALAGGLVLWSRTRAGRLAIDSLLLKLPVLGTVARKMVMSRFARTFGILTRSGLPLLDGLALVQGASGNAAVARAIALARDRIAAGQGITSAFRSTGRFPEMVLQLMSTGEESGHLEAMMLKASDFYDRQVEASMQSLTSLIEPAMIVLVGGVVGVVVISMFLPIFSLGNAVSSGGFNY